MPEFFPERVIHPGKPSRRDLVPALAREPMARASRLRAQADLLNLSTEARLRLEWLIFHRTVAGGSVTATCAYFGIARSTFQRWEARFDKGIVKNLEDHSSRPHSVRSWRPDPLVLERMLALRREHPAWGKETLSAVYWSFYGETVSPWQFQRMLQTFRMSRPEGKRRPARKVSAKQRITYALRRNASQLWQLDTVHVDERPRRYVITGVEHTTKLGYAVAYERATSTAARDFAARLRYVFGVELKVVLTDNGSEFAGAFDRALKMASVDRYYSRPRRPTDNPEVERFNQTMQTEWLLGAQSSDVAQP